MVIAGQAHRGGHVLYVDVGQLEFTHVLTEFSWTEVRVFDDQVVAALQHLREDAGSGRTD